MSEEAVASLREEFESLRTNIKAFMIAQKQTGGDPDREQAPEGDTPPTPYRFCKTFKKSNIGFLVAKMYPKSAQAMKILYLII
jgi:hypothetical protein